MEYKIEVIMTPDEYAKKIAKPYYWRLASYTGKDWCTHTAGWSATPEDAWKEAYTFYTSFIQPIGVEE